MEFFDNKSIKTYLIFYKVILFEKIKKFFNKLDISYK